MTGGRARRCRSRARRFAAAAGVGTAVMVVGMSDADAQEVDPDPGVAGSISECTLTATAQVVLPTGFVTGGPVDLELTYVSDVPVLTYFVLDVPDADDVRLNDGTAATTTLTPEVAGTYTIYGEFEDAATHELLEVATPETCTVTAEVVDAPVVEPPVDPGPCVDDEDLTLVPIGDDVFEAYDDEGNLCAVIAGETVTRPEQGAPAELPATGSSTVPLAATGVALIGLGWATRRAAARARAG